MTAPNTMAKRAAAGTLALAVCFTGGILTATTATAAPGFTFSERISGSDRTATSIAASKAAFDGGSDTVIIVERDAVVDGLTASYIAGTNTAPILYVDRQGVPDEVAAEIKRLGATKAILVGGTAVLPQAVVTQLESANVSVTRQSGADRYATAAAVALSGSKTPDKVIVASGEVPADALAAGPVAYAKNYPLVLVRPDTVPASTKSALDQLGNGERLAIGGTVRISASVYNSLGDPKRRVSGTNRQQTAIALADIATGELGFNKDRVALVSDQDRAAVDALVASPVAGSNLAPLLFSAGTTLGNDTTKYLQDHAAELTGTGYVFGGTNAVPQNVVDAAETAAQGEAMPPTGNASLAITPTDALTLTVADETGKDKATDDRQYMVSGLDDDTEYRIALIEAENLVFDADGMATLKRSGTSKTADFGAVVSTVTVVNGTVITANRATSAQPVDGQIRFTVDGGGFESVVPVIFTDSNDDNKLAIDDDDKPSESFGLGGRIDYLPEEAAFGDPGTAPADIEQVNKDGKTIVATDASGSPETRLYRYDSNDRFYVGGSTPADEVTLDEFEEVLTKGDDLATNTSYNPSSPLQSTFVLNNTNPAPPVVVDFDSTDSTITANVDESTIEDDATVNIYVADDNGDFDSVDRSESSDVDGDDDTSNFQITISGLDANENYQIYVTQTVDGEESEPASTTAVAGNDASTTAATDGDLSISGITVNDVNDGTTGPNSNQVIVTFDKAITGAPVAGGLTVNPTNQPGLTNVSTAATAVVGNNKQVLYTLTTALNDATTDVAYTAKVSSSGVRTADGVSPALSGTFSY